MTPLRISGKNLGQLALPDFCPRCFWLKLHCDGKLPFAVFPGIFASIDGLTKKVTAAHFAKHDRLPTWFSELGDIIEIIPVPHHSKFQWQDPATGIVLSGAPDELVRKRDGSLVIPDYKTSKFSKTQDALAPLYRTQLNSYAAIAERIGLGKVSGLALIYFEPKTEVDAESIDEVCSVDGFNMRFRAKVLPVALEPDSILPLLARAREIFDLQFPPTGRAGCKDCGLLAGLVAMLTSPLPNAERERLEWKLRELREQLGFSRFEDGLWDEELRTHRVGLLAAEEANRKRDADQKRMRLEISALEQQLRAGGGKSECVLIKSVSFCCFDGTNRATMGPT